jgi:CheY-like chemotaxis protein
MDNLLSGRSILVVEDEMLLLLHIEDMLADHGCTSVCAAANPDRAVALIGTHDFDAAMVDLNLDGTKSYRVADALAARGVPFLFSTGYSPASLALRYRDRPVLGKPYLERQLGEMLAGLLRPRRDSAS